MTLENPTKIVVGITVFNGIELLESCIRNYEKFADEIIICYQNRSNAGNYDPTVEDVVYKFDCHILQFVPDVKDLHKNNEMRKHDMMVKFAKEIGGTHFILSAVDHFYKEEQVQNVLQEALEYDTTFTKIHTYYKYPTWQITPQVPWVMPFLFKLREGTHIQKVANYPLFTDPACKVDPIGNWKLYDESDLVLYNYSNVRDDFPSKVHNRNVPLRWSTRFKQEIIDQFNTYDPSKKEPILYYKHGAVTINEVPNYFNL